jgi:hypothetical protein
LCAAGGGQSYGGSSHGRSGKKGKKGKKRAQVGAAACLVLAVLSPVAGG